jgi:hypothetical protein
MLETNPLPDGQKVLHLSRFYGQFG